MQTAGANPQKPIVTTQYKSKDGSSEVQENNSIFYPSNE
jgi:hypothetical protein